MDIAKYRIEIFYRVRDPRAGVFLEKFRRMGFNIENIYLTDNYLINIDIDNEKIQRIASSLINPVTQNYIINEPFYPPDFKYAVEIGFLPGVTDNVAHTTREIIEDLLKEEVDPEKSVFTSSTYFLRGDIDRDKALKAGMELHNPLIQRMKVFSSKEYNDNGGMGRELPVVKLHERLEIDEVNLDVPGDELMTLGRQGIQDKDGTRRGPLALDMASLDTIKEYFTEKEKRNPTDVELESIAQTWSEHCKHTIFASKLDDIEEGIYKRYIKGATEKIRKEKGRDDFCLSVFKDNSGGIEFDENWVVSDKVETHNSPSALDPFGGAITGIVGVNRDAIGFGMGAKPVANRYGFCFADPFDRRPLFREKNRDSQLLSPRRIMEGVIRGVEVGGNCSGIPTPQGFVYFDERYKGKPLVFVGTVGLMPKTVCEKPAVSKKAEPGDCIVMIGGRVGRDGIHGATFSSEALSSGSPATAVQIGDPITQKKLSDAVVKEARDTGLFNSITDNGAGGLSCSVAEMAREAGGFEVDLEKIPLKYPGLAPWQIWVSESQERMTLSIPEEKLGIFEDLMRRRGVETAVIGRFTGSGRGIVRYKGKEIFNLDLDFLHEGLPAKILKTTPAESKGESPDFPGPENYTEVFHDMVSRLNTASIDFISTLYDHEVQANSVIKPLQGRGMINGNASVIRPVPGSRKGVVLSQALYPSYSDIDTYWMAACSIDTAVRNAVSAGCSIDRLALLDNFCWCDSNNPERLYQLKEAARACYDFSVAFGTPFISGKDSMFNDFKGYDENFNEVFISVPPTLLISSIGVVEDIGVCQTIDFKFEGDYIYVIGETGDETGGSEYLAYTGQRISGNKFTGDRVPRVDAGKNSSVYRAVCTALRKGLLASCVSIERGGLGVALAKSAMAGLIGCAVDLSIVPCADTLRDDIILYSESQGRLLVSVAPAKAEDFEAFFNGLPYAKIGETREERVSISSSGGGLIVDTDVGSLMESHKGLFRDF